MGRITVNLGKLIGFFPRPGSRKSISKSTLEHPKSWPEKSHLQAVTTHVSLEKSHIAHRGALKSKDKILIFVTD